MIAVIIPAHNEARRLGRCLKSVKMAVDQAQQAGHQVEVVVVLDSCTDSSAAVAKRHGVHLLQIDARNVGTARRCGAAFILRRGARWLACTDADSQVPPNWLLSQLGCSAEVVCGTVHVQHWQPWQTAALRKLYRSRYQAQEGHRHVHGANLGICAAAYERVGGFQPLPAHEDVQLVADLQASGARIVWTARHSVATSSRRDSRARDGFADYLAGLQAHLM
ncbi:glycosyltransferase [Pseudomonas sp. NPDC089408]|uniref:glycosyltransferase n=1 Tax=Pseudomonas sp. NPDC089408 TaxID=3364465 RepID=UPI0038188DBC